MPDGNNGEGDAIKTELSKVFDEVWAYFKELEGESPRAAAVLAVASIEHQLGRLIRGKFPKISDKLWKEIAGPGFTPLGSFKARITMAHAFGFYGPTTRQTLETVAVIRNKFAHQTEVRDFDHQLVVREMKALQENPFAPFTWNSSMSAQEMRETFIAVCRQLEKSILEVQGRQLAAEMLGEREPQALA